MKKETIKKLLQNLISIVVLVIVWLVASLIANSEFLFPSPLSVVKEVCNYLVTPLFYKSVFSTTIKVIVGFLISLVAGVGLAYLSFKSKAVKNLFYPLLVVMRAAPTMSIVFIALIYFSPRVSPVVVSCMVIFPVLYTSALTGLEETDEKLIEMSKFFKVKKSDTVKNLYLPSLFERLYSDSVSALSLNVKLIIAAESWASQVNDNLGTLLTAVKSELETAKLFALTLLAVLLSFALELLLRLVKKSILSSRRKRQCRNL